MQKVKKYSLANFELITKDIMFKVMNRKAFKLL